MMLFVVVNSDGADAIVQALDIESTVRSWRRFRGGWYGSAIGQSAATSDASLENCRSGYFFGACCILVLSNRIPCGMTGPEAVVWPMSEAAAVLLDRSLGWSEQKTAMKMEWLLAELEQRFGYSLEELAQRLDRSVSWVSRPLALVELSPQEIQQHARGQPMLPRA
jgi:hypothetical protein